jgi:hypothetical protein
MTTTGTNRNFLATPGLMQVFNFDDDDLAVNRQGRLSSSQRTSLRFRFFQLTLLTLVVASAPVILVVVSIGILLTANRYSSDTSSITTAAIIILIFGTGMGLIGFYYIFRMWRRNRRALVDGVVSNVEGVVGLRDIGNTRYQRYALYVTDDGGRNLGFNITRDASKAFDEEMRYRVYFVPANNYVVAAEELND